MKSINLDDESEVESFIANYGNIRGKKLANLLGLVGKGGVKLANSFSNYAWNKLTAISLRKNGNISNAMVYEKICDKIYNSIPIDSRPW